MENMKHNIRDTLKNLKEYKEKYSVNKDELECTRVFDLLDDISLFLILLPRKIDDMITDINFDHTDLKLEDGATTQEKTASYIRNVLDKQISDMINKGI